MASISGANDEDICAICLENLNKPVKLPCHHSFCSTCLDGWRSKYDARSKRSCPQCRANVPPSREMVIQLSVNRQLCHTIQEKLNEPGPLSLDDTYISSFFISEGIEIIRSIHDPDQQQIVLRAAIQMRLGPLQESTAQLEQAVGNSEHLLEDTEDDEMDLPMEIGKAAGANNVKVVLDWLGPRPVPVARINAKCRAFMNRTLLHEAEFQNNIGLMRLLLQLGAKVDPKSAFGMTPFQQACHNPELDEVARLLLTWGAATDKHDEYARDAKLVDLLETPLGGRRCEIVGLQSRADLNGKTCVATRYLPKQERYEAHVEETDEQVQIRPANLQRRDRTQLDLGKILIYRGSEGSERQRFEEGLCFRSAEEADAFSSTRSP